MNGAQPASFFMNRASSSAQIALRAWTSGICSVGSIIRLYAGMLVLETLLLPTFTMCSPFRITSM